MAIPMKPTNIAASAKVSGLLIYLETSKIVALSLATFGL
jgi:hypothetical protein